MWEKHMLHKILSESNKIWNCSKQQNEKRFYIPLKEAFMKNREFLTFL